MSKVEVTLVSQTDDPIRTIYEIWQCSKSSKSLEVIRDDYGLAMEMKEAQRLHPERPKCQPKWTADWPDPTVLFGSLLEAKVPVMENIDLVFILEGVSISFREQMVRHRIGVKVGERIGMDLAPNQHDSTFWAQSMRILPMENFAKDEMYIVPEWFQKRKVWETRYRAHMESCANLYASAVEEGCPREQAREVFPLGATHSISWKLNVGSLSHIIGKRGCWILQLGYWGPILEGMIAECVEKIHPAFAKLVTPPCIKNEEFRGCLYKEDVERRISGDDHLPPCSLYLNRERENRDVVLHDPPPGWTHDQYDSMREKYRKFWHRDPDTGALLA